MSFIVVNIILEIFTSGTKLYKFSKFMFSVVLVFSVFTLTINAFSNFSGNMDDFVKLQDNEAYFETQITNLENIISTRLELEFSSPMTVKINYSYDNSKIEYEKVCVETYGADVINAQIESVIGEYLDCKVEIR